MARETDEKTDSRLATRLAALASLGAAAIHFAVAPAHWREWILSGLFFALIASWQLIWARAVLTRATPPMLAAGILLNAGAIALWAVSRTAGAPFGPHAGQPELVKGADLCALLLQSYVVMGAAWVWYRGRRAQRIPGPVNAVLLLVFGSVIASAATLGVASGMQHGHHAPAGAGPDHHTPTAGHGQGHHQHPEPATPPSGESPQPLKMPAPAQAPPPAVDAPHDAEGDHHHRHSESH